MLFVPPSPATKSSAAKKGAFQPQQEDLLVAGLGNDLCCLLMVPTELSKVSSARDGTSQQVLE
jgi:hypothetical protein